LDRCSSGRLGSDVWSSGLALWSHQSRHDRCFSCYRGSSLRCDGFGCSLRDRSLRFDGSVRVEQFGCLCCMLLVKRSWGWLVNSRRRGSCGRSGVLLALLVDGGGNDAESVGPSGGFWSGRLGPLCAMSGSRTGMRQKRRKNTSRVTIESALRQPTSFWAREAWVGGVDQRNS
jgi:hypothetical protein